MTSFQIGQMHGIVTQSLLDKVTPRICSVFYNTEHSIVHICQKHAD